MRQVILFLLMLTAAGSIAQAQTGAISGTVYDDNKEPLIGAEVKVYQMGKVRGADYTDEDGRYTIKPLQPGSDYDLHVNYASYRSQIVRNVLVVPDRTTYQNISMELNVNELSLVTVREYKVPLIKKGERGTTTTMTSEQIEKLPTRQTSDVASMQGGTYQSRSGVNIAGGRGSGTLYIVDGVQVNGGQPVYYNPSEESYAKVRENDFRTVKANPLSTMSVDVDRAAYSNIRRFISEGQKPPTDAVRIEEMVNYFHYDYPQPKGEDPIAIVTELTDCPWNANHQLLRIGMQAKTVNTEKLPPSNLVFLIDVSGSMASYNKLPLVKQSLKLLVGKLRAADKVAIVVYAGSAGLVLPPTPGNDKEVITAAIDRLEAGGSTAGGAGIQLAYNAAQQHFIEGGNNRVILATDGDFNVGISADNELETLIENKRRSGIFLTCLGFGMGNYKDSKLETLADKGNGNYAYIDSREEAEKILVTEFGGTLFTIAKDVKAQIEFNPAKVQGYRLVGYENRLLNEEDFKDDKKDAGEMGSGHQVTILYELIPAGLRSGKLRPATDLKYQHPEETAHTGSDELATVKFRYKKPDESSSREMVHVIEAQTNEMQQCSADTRFAVAVAMFGMMLRESKFARDGDLDDVLQLAETGSGADKEGYREGFIKMVRQADRRLTLRD